MAVGDVLSVSMKELNVLLGIEEKRNKRMSELESSLAKAKEEVDEMRLQLDYQLCLNGITNDGEPLLSPETGVGTIKNPFSGLLRFFWG